MSCLIFQYTRSSPPLAAPRLCVNWWLACATSPCMKWRLRIESGVLPFFLNRFDETNSLLENAQGPESAEDNELYEHVGRIDVRVTTLDDWCAAELPTGDLVIKADMQGAEARMLAGGRRTVRGWACRRTVQRGAFRAHVCGPGKLLGPARDAYDEARPCSVADLSTPPRSRRASHLERWLWLRDDALALMRR